MTNLSSDELRLIVTIRNISDYQNKSKKALIKALSEPEPKPKPEPNQNRNQNQKQNQK